MNEADARLAALQHDPRYQDLVRRRGRLGWTLTAVMLFVYFGFILLVAFAKPFLAQSLAGGATSVGIPIGLGVIGCAIVLTGIYVRRANTVFDAEVAAIVAAYEL